MSYELGRAILLSELVSPAALQSALFTSVTQGTHLVRALLATGAIDEPALEEILARAEAPVVRTVVPVPDLVARVPAPMWGRLLALPVRLDPVTGTVDVAMVDVRDTHGARELEHHLASPVRALRAPLAAVEDALRRRRESRPPPSSHAPSHFPQRLSMPGVPSVAPRKDTPPWGTPVHTPRLSEPPRPSSDIPIPLTRRHYAPVPGGTQRPPPLYDPNDGLPAVFALDGLPQAAVERAAPPSRVSRPPPPPEPPAHLRGHSSAPPHLAPQRPQRERRSVTPQGLGVSRTPASLHPARIAGYDAPALYGTDLEGAAPDSLPPGSLIPGPPPMPSRAPYGPTHGAPSLPFGDASSALGALKSATDRDQVLDILLFGARMVARRVAIFVVKRGGFVGWSCTPEFGDRAALQALLVPTTSASILSTATSEGLYLGAIRHDEVHAPLLRLMQGASRDVAATAVRVAGRTALVIVADELGDTMIATRRLEELARAAGDALSRILRSKR